ncbi:MAG: SDR family oxidoreductase [Bacteroidales bacterium]|nr:SDR family oxidoreductase [Bacteroidales bacterium]
MNLELADSVAVVFGAARGLGYAIAEGFAAEGADVRLVDRDARVTASAQQLTRSGRTVEAEQLDVTDYAAVQAFAARLTAQAQPPEHLVYAVGIGSGKFGFPFWNLDPSDWDHVLRVNLIGAVNVAHAFAPFLAGAGRGTLLFLSSVAGQIGSQTDPPYSAAKAGLINFAQCAAKDLAPFGVRVNTLCPGMIRTELNKSVWQAWADQQPAEQRRSYEDWADEKVKRVVPLGRWQTAADIAAMAVFLASPRAGNITGQTINVDGGFVMHW